jgi:NAD(P)H-dependent FMN reductase
LLAPDRIRACAAACKRREAACGLFVEVRESKENTTMATKVKVILGSVRTGRSGKPVADWVMRRAQDYDGDLEFELVDLKEVNLPFLDEPVPPRVSDEYAHEHTRRWSETVKDADALVVVTPEYNHGYPPVLKNAIDFLYNEWQGMPVGLVGYGGSGATHAIRQLREVMEVVGMKVLEDQVTISHIWEALDDDGNVKLKNTRGDIQELFRKLENAQNDG